MKNQLHAKRSRWPLTCYLETSVNGFSEAEAGRVMTGPQSFPRASQNTTDRKAGRCFLSNPHGLRNVWLATARTAINTKANRNLFLVQEYPWGLSSTKNWKSRNALFCYNGMKYKRPSQATCSETPCLLWKAEETEEPCETQCIPLTMVAGWS